MRTINISIVLLLLFTSCKTLIKRDKEMKNNITSFDLNKYDLYKFQLLRKKSDLPHPVFTNGLDRSQNDLVYEELYLFLDESSNQVLYVTTFSHKYIWKGGVFNNDLSQKHISANQLDRIYIGETDGDKITFLGSRYPSVDTLEFYYTQSDEAIKIDSVTNTYGRRSDRNKTPYVNLSKVFDLEMTYQKDTASTMVHSNNGLFNVDQLGVQERRLYFRVAKEAGNEYWYIKKRVGNKIFHIK